MSVPRLPAAEDRWGGAAAGPAAPRASSRGVTLIELLVTLIIGSVAFMALAVPFVAERSFWAAGNAQAESQRDAEMTLRAIARLAREGVEYKISGAPGSNTLTLCSKKDCTSPTQSIGIIGSFCGGQAFADQLQHDSGKKTCTETATTLVGGRSRVTNFSVIPVNDRLVRIDLTVIHNNRESQQLTTELFLRNWNAT